MRPLPLLVLALVASACTDTLPNMTDGSRLKAITITVDGEPMWDGVFDTQLGVECSYRRTDSGALRCLPWNTTSVTVSYADEGCTEQIFRPNSECAPHPFLVTRRPLECGEGVAFFRAGETLELERRYRLTGQGCIATESPGTYKKLVPVDENEFVAGELKVEPLDDRIGAEVVVGADGSRVLRTFHDLELGAGCLPGLRDGDAQVRCYPTRVAARTESFEETCLDKVARWVPSGVVAQCRPGVITARKECGPVQYFKPGERVEKLYSSPEEGVCEATSFQQNETYWRIGPLIDVTTLPEAELEVEGSGRGARHVLVAGGSALESNELDDPELGFTNGYAWWAEDGKYRLIPNATAEVKWDIYEDATCSKPLAVPNDPCPEEEKFAYSYPEGCNVDGFVVYRITAKHTGAVYSVDGDDACVEVPEEERPALRYSVEKMDPTTMLETPRTMPGM